MKDEMKNMLQFNTWCFFCSREDLQTEIQLPNNAAIVLVNYGERCEEMSCSVEGENIYGVEIKAETKEKAKDVADILCACHTIVEGDNMESPEEIIRRFDKDPANWLTQIGRKGVVYPDDALLEACRLLSKAYGDQKLENAVCKYYVAHDVYKLHPMDLHPLEDPFISEYLLSERIRIANVIVECYSILEELHMQIKASRENPSVIDGRWNPLVKAELIERLKTKGIDPDKKVPWSTRNGVVRPFKTDVVDAGDLCEWSDGTEICDFNISICDAILELSYMRSQLSSHSLGDNILKLSVYDADNAFFLARYLLAKHLGKELISE